VRREGDGGGSEGVELGGLGGEEGLEGGESLVVRVIDGLLTRKS
jgi:hypothetical protein